MNADWREILRSTVSKEREAISKVRFRAILACVLSLILTSHSNAQGTFQNLNFEGALVPPTPIGGYGGEVDPALAFLGWTVGANTNPYPLFTLYNNQTLDSAAVDLIGPAFPNALGMSSLQGSYSVVLQYSTIWRMFPQLSQTGLIPADAKSINFLVSSDPYIFPPFVTLNGTWINLVPIGGGRLAGDVTAFAGSPAQMTFSTGAYRAYFDDVRFSSERVPEPSMFTLSSLGVLLASWRLAVRARGKSSPSLPA